MPTFITQIIEYLPLILSGAWVTFSLALLSLLFAIIIGLIGASMMLSRLFFIRSFFTIYSTIFRGVPDLVWMLLLFYGIQVLINDLTDAMHVTPIEINPFLAGAITLSLIFAAYFAETFRGAILAVPKGLIEAGHSYGMTNLQVFRRITFPLLMRFALPGVKNNWQVLIKSTALVSIIGLDDMVRRADQAGGATHAAFLFNLVVACLFLIITIVSLWILTKFERHYNKGVKEYQHGK